MKTIADNLNDVKIEDANVEQGAVTIAAFINLLDNASLDELKELKQQLGTMGSDFSLKMSHRRLAKEVLKPVRSEIKAFN